MFSVCARRREPPGPVVLAFVGRLVPGPSRVRPAPARGLHPVGGEGKANLSRLRDHRQPQRVRHALLVRLAVGRERRTSSRAETRTEAPAAPRRRTGPARRPRSRTCAPGRARRPRRRRARGSFSWPSTFRPAFPRRPRSARSGTGGRAPRRRSRRAARRVLITTASPSVSRRGGEEGDALAGDRVVDCVAGADHFLPPSGVVVDNPHSGARGLENRRLCRRFGLGRRTVFRAGASSSGRTSCRPAGRGPDSYASTTAWTRSRRLELHQDVRRRGS